MNEQVVSLATKLQILATSADELARSGCDIRFEVISWFGEEPFTVVVRPGTEQSEFEPVHRVAWYRVRELMSREEPRVGDSVQVMMYVHGRAYQVFTVAVHGNPDTGISCYHICTDMCPKIRVEDKATPVAIMSSTAFDVANGDF